jgi:hypothetical protein
VIPEHVHWVWPWWDWLVVAAAGWWLWRKLRWFYPGVRRFRRPKHGTRGPRGRSVVFRGQEYPSQVQAAWAKYFFEHGVLFEPEPDRFSYDLGDGVFYRPDFWLPGKEHWLEVKAGSDQLTAEVREKAQRLASKSGSDVQLVVGWPGRHRELWFRARERVA